MRLILISLLCVIMLLSCSEEAKNYPVGSDFIDNDINISVIDTFLIKRGTFKLDSVITSNARRILLGSVIDPNFGHITSQSFFEVKTSNFSIASNAVYDSIGFVLNYDTYHYGDTLQTQTYKVHRVLETIRPDEGDDFYNTSEMNFDSEVLGEISFTPRPNRDLDSLYIPLKYELGEEIFNKIKNNDVNNADDFTQFFKGLTIIPNTLTDSHMLGFNVKTTANAEKSSSMRLYYTINDDDGEDNDYMKDFFVSSSIKQFNTIKTNLTNTSLDNFEDEETIIPSNETNELIFAQAGSGISARIEIPYLKDLKDLAETGTVLSAKLTFNPKRDSYDENKPLKDSLAVYVIDHKNRILNQLTNLSANTAYAILNQVDDEFNAETYYSIDLSAYIEEILASTYN